MLSKLFWFLINLFRHDLNSNRLSHSLPSSDTSGKVICVIVEYDKFLDRDIKEVGGVRYTCGKASTQLVKTKCALNKIPVLQVMTTDNQSLCSESEDVTERIFIRNRGTDIAALEDIIEKISGYQSVIFCNSSAPFQQIEKYIDSFLAEIKNDESVPKVIGLNGNSRPSPALSIFHTKFPHVITNFFYANITDVKDVLHIGKKSVFYKAFGGYGNKYFAVRYFEILLSTYVLKRGGKLACIYGAVHYFPDQAWFDQDSRIKEFFNQQG